MTNFIAVAKTSEVPDGTIKEVLIRGREILLAKVDGKYYAADNRCPHLGDKLSLGKLEGTVVTCPRHGSQFDLVDGRVVQWTNWSGLISKLSQVIKSPRPLQTYQVRIENDRLLVEI